MYVLQENFKALCVCVCVYGWFETKRAVNGDRNKQTNVGCACSPTSLIFVFVYVLGVHPACASVYFPSIRICIEFRWCCLCATQLLSPWKCVCLGRHHRLYMCVSVGTLFEFNIYCIIYTTFICLQAPLSNILNGSEVMVTFWCFIEFNSVTAFSFKEEISVRGCMCVRVCLRPVCAQTPAVCGPRIKSREWCQVSPWRKIETERQERMWKGFRTHIHTHPHTLSKWVTYTKNTSLAVVNCKAHTHFR